MTQRRSALPAIALLALVILAAGPAAAQTTAPGAPSSLQVAVDGHRFTFTWAVPASGGAPTGYTLVARVSAGGPLLAAIPVGNVTSYAATGPTGTYLVSVTASNAVGTGPESTSVTVTLPTVPAPPGAPSGLGTTVAGDTATFTWNAPSSGGPVGGYLLLAGQTPGFSVPLASLPLPATPASASVAGVPPGTYYVRLHAQNSGGSSAPSNETVVTVAGPAAPAAPTLSYSGTGNTLELSWEAGAGGVPTSYVLTASTTSGALVATVPLSGSSATFPGVPSGTYVLRLVGVNAVGASPSSSPVTVTLPIVITPPTGPIVQIGNDITGGGGYFGYALALSADGQRLAVGAYSTGNGTTRVYQRTGNTWTQLGADIVGEASGDRSGIAVDLNDGGTRVAIGAYHNDAGGTNRGHVRVFDLVGSTWQQLGADIDGTRNNGQLGYSLALSGDGNRLVAGVPYDNNPDGDAKVFDLVGGVWTQVGATLSGTHEFGADVAISADGTTIALPSKSASGLSRAGTVQVFRLSGGNWTQVGNTLQGEQISDNFGDHVSLSADGQRIAVSAPADDENGTNAGKVKVFDLVGNTWTQVGQDVLGLSGQNIGEHRMALSADGTRFIVNAASSSLAKVYQLGGGTWTQVGTDVRGGSRAEGATISANGSTIAVGWVYGTNRVRVFSVAP